MKTMILTIAICLLSIGSLLSQDVITIVHVNDTHSYLAPLGPRDANLKGTLGGIARAATIIGKYKESGPNVLALHAGDVFMGDMFFNKYFGAAEFQIMNLMGFDGMAVGNHEFDLMPSTLNTALDSSLSQYGFPLLSANLFLDSVPTLKKYINAFTIKQIGSSKVGIFGLTTPETNVFSMPAPVVVDTNFIPIAGQMVETLRSAGCNVVICLSHLGMYYDQLVATYVPGINIIVGGHDHLQTPQPVEIINPSNTKTYIVQTDGYYKHVGHMEIKVDGNDVSLLSYESIEVNNTVKENEMIAGIVDNLTKDIESVYGPVYSQVAGYAGNTFREVADSLTTYGIKDTPIGNLVTDAFRSHTKTDIAIEVGGSTSQPVNEGPLVAADYFRVFGYGFNTNDGLGYQLVTFKMYGAALLAGLEFGVSQVELNDELLMQVSGMNYVYDAAKPVGSRIIAANINGIPVNPEAIYTITGNEQVPAFLSFLQIPYQDLLVMTGYTEFQALLNYATNLQSFHPYIQGRVICSDKPTTELWRETSAPLDSKYTDMLIKSNGNIFATSETKGVLCSTDKGLTWQKKNTGFIVNNSTAISELPNGDLLASSNGIYRSIDNGDTWTSTSYKTGTFSSFCSASNNVVYAGGAAGIFKSTDNGSNWSKLINGLPNQGAVLVQKIAITPNGKLIAASSSGIFTSADNGANWTTVMTGHRVSDILITKTGTIIVGGTGIYISKDGGNSFVAHDTVSFAMTLTLSNSNVIYAAMRNVVYSSEDEGQTWKPLNSKLPNTFFSKLIVDKDGYLIGASQYDGIFISTVANVTKVDLNNANTPKSFNLMQNYPNPFNPSTRISYQLPIASNVTLRVYDITGKEVITLVNSYQQSGSYSVDFNAQNISGQQLASGVYLCQLRADKFVDTKKLMFVK